MRDDRNREPEVCLASLTDINMKEARPAGPQVPSSVWSPVNTSTLSYYSQGSPRPNQMFLGQDSGSLHCISAETILVVSVMILL